MSFLDHFHCGSSSVSFSPQLPAKPYATGRLPAAHARLNHTDGKQAVGWEKGGQLDDPAPSQLVLPPTRSPWWGLPPRGGGQGDLSPPQGRARAPAT